MTKIEPNWTRNTKFEQVGHTTLEKRALRTKNDQNRKKNTKKRALKTEKGQK